MQIAAGTGDTKENQTINLAKWRASFVDTVMEYAGGMDSANKKDSDQAVLGVNLNISEAGKQKLKEQDNFLSFLQDQLDSIQEQKEAGEDGWEEFGKCLKIAMSIASGDNVPQQDIQYLKEHNPELFGQAMALRMPKKDPEDCESVLEDEDSEGSEDSGSGSARIVESGASVETGGGESAGTVAVSAE